MTTDLFVAGLALCALIGFGVVVYALGSLIDR